MYSESKPLDLHVGPTVIPSFQDDRGTTDKRGD